MVRPHAAAPVGADRAGVDVKERAGAIGDGDVLAEVDGLGLLGGDEDGPAKLLGARRRAMALEHEVLVRRDQRVGAVGLKRREAAGHRLRVGAEAAQLVAEGFGQLDEEVVLARREDEGEPGHPGSRSLRRRRSRRESCDHTRRSRKSEKTEKESSKVGSTAPAALKASPSRSTRIRPSPPQR